MAEAGDSDELCSKRKAISTLFLYAVLQERDGKPEILETVLRTARASKVLPVLWYAIGEFVDVQLSTANPRALVLASLYILLYAAGEYFIQRWTAATSVVPYTEEVSRSVVDTLLQIAANDKLSPHVTVNVWTWFTKRPSLPPISLGRHCGSELEAVKTVRGLKDTEVLKSYMLLLWSEWDDDGFDEMCASIREDFSGIGTGRHRADLAQRLDYILGQLDRGLEYLKQHNSRLDDGDIHNMRVQYGELKDVSLETNIGAIARASYSVVMLLRTNSGGHAQNLARRLCVHFLPHVHSSASVTLKLTPPLHLYPRLSTTVLIPSATGDNFCRVWPLLPSWAICSIRSYHVVFFRVCIPTSTHGI